MEWLHGFTMAVAARVRIETRCPCWRDKTRGAWRDVGQECVRCHVRLRWIYLYV